VAQALLLTVASVLKEELMTRTVPAVVILLASFGAACADKAAQERNAALEKRIAELEAQVSPSPSPATVEAYPAGRQPADAPSMRTLPAEQDLPAIRPRPAAPPARTAKPKVVDDGPYIPGPLPVPATPAPAAPAPVEPPDYPADPPARVEQPAPQPEPIVLPQGTELSLILETPLSSATSQRGDRVTARVEKAAADDGRVVLPGGTVLEGHVSDAAPSGRVKGRARIAVTFDRIVVRGRTHELQASPVTVEAPDDHGRDAKIVGGAAAAGTVIGAISGGKKGAVKGAVIGAAAGGGAVLATKGREVELPAGSHWKIQLRDRVRL
jgi:hypothetical protein